jgi:hypothetical protein
LCCLGRPFVRHRETDNGATVDDHRETTPTDV